MSLLYGLTITRRETFLLDFGARAPKRVESLTEGVLLSDFQDAQRFIGSALFCSKNGRIKGGLNTDVERSRNNGRQADRSKLLPLPEEDQTF